MGTGLAIVGAACGSDDTSDTSTRASSVSVTTSYTGAGGTGGGGSGSGAGGAGPTTGGNGGGGNGNGGAGGNGGNGGGNGTGGNGNSAMTADVLQDGFYINCQPIVSPDPVIGSFAAVYDNSMGTTPGLATITEVALVMTNSSMQTLTWSFTVTPPTSGSVPAGQNAVVSHSKVVNSGMGMGVGSPCGYCQGTWELQVTWNIGANVVPYTMSLGAVDCVY